MFYEIVRRERFCFKKSVNSTDEVIETNRDMGRVRVQNVYYNISNILTHFIQLEHFSIQKIRKDYFTGVAGCAV